MSYVKKIPDRNAWGEREQQGVGLRMAGREEGRKEDRQQSKGRVTPVKADVRLQWGDIACCMLQQKHHR
jgi:hypothetical protein